MCNVSVQNFIHYLVNKKIKMVTLQLNSGKEKDLLESWLYSTKSVLAFSDRNHINFLFIVNQILMFPWFF